MIVSKTFTSEYIADAMQDATDFISSGSCRSVEAITTTIDRERADAQYYTVVVQYWQDDVQPTDELPADSVDVELVLHESEETSYGAYLTFNTPTNGYLNNLTYGMTDRNADGDAFAVVTEFSYESPEPYTEQTTAAMEKLIMAHAAAKGYAAKSVLWLTGSNIWD